MGMMINRRRVMGGKYSGEKIKLYWNMLLKNGNFSNADYWYNYMSNITIDENSCIIVKTTTEWGGFVYNSSVITQAQHVYFLSVVVDYLESKKEDSSLAIAYPDAYSTNNWDFFFNTRKTGRLYGVGRATRNTEVFKFRYGVSRTPVNTKGIISKAMLIDLTQMFGEGNEPTADEFVRMFPYEYYDYNSGTEIVGYIKSNGEFSNQPTHL